jgi:hypothetical protein
VSKYHADQLLGFRAALFFGAGIALAAVILDVLFVRVIKDEREGWRDPADETASGLSDFDQGISTAMDSSQA